MTGVENDDWQMQVRDHLKAGFGVEDIALKLDCPTEDVREEVKILRGENRLTTIYRRKPGVRK